MLVLSKINLEERRGGGGGGGGWRRTGLFLAIESFYFCQDGRRKWTFFLFVLISFVQGVCVRSEKMDRFYGGGYCVLN